MFWAEIDKGFLPEQAAGVAGVAQAVGAQWFHNAGGMPPFDLQHQPSGRYLSFAEREEIAVLTQNLYTHVFDELSRDAADKIAALIPRRQQPAAT